MLRIATAAWWSLIMLRLVRREVVRAAKTAVCGNRRRHRPLIEGGWPTSCHLDRLDAGLSPRDEVYLAGLDAEIPAGLPMPLRVVLTRQLTGLTSRRWLS